MKWLAALSLLLFAAPAPEIRYFKFQRPIAMPGASSGQTCLVVDPDVFPQAAPQLGDLRLYSNSSETPFVLRSAPLAGAANQSVPALNRGQRGQQAVFDAEMPPTRYSDLTVDIDAHDFLATVTVFGSQTKDATSRTTVGSFTIFDLTAQKLGRSTVLHLPESDFRYLHFSISGHLAANSVKGLSVMQKPAAPPRYVTLQESANGKQAGRNTEFEFTVPAHTPVERVVFAPGPQPANFARDVKISVWPTTPPKADDSAGPPEPATAYRDILSVHSTSEGRRIDEERLSADAPEVRFDGPTKWSIAVDNKDDAPLGAIAVRLEMLERNLCFEAAAGSTYELYYGDSALAAPQYNYATFFSAQPNPIPARLGPEAKNPAYQPRPDERPFTEKHPALLWIGLIVVIGLLGAIALRSMKAKPAHV